MSITILNTTWHVQPALAGSCQGLFSCKLGAWRPESNPYFLPPTFSSLRSSEPEAYNSLGGLPSLENHAKSPVTAQRKQFGKDGAAIYPSSPTEPQDVTRMRWPCCTSSGEGPGRGGAAAGWQRSLTRPHPKSWRKKAGKGLGWDSLQLGAPSSSTQAPWEA